MLINQVLYFNIATKHLKDFEMISKTIHYILECKVSVKERQKKRYTHEDI